jgi:hypothetical protein
MTWEELAKTNLETALYLRGTKDPRFARGVCGRAYYAVYALVTASIPETVTFGRGWKNPEHARLTSYVNQVRDLREGENATYAGRFAA